MRRRAAGAVATGVVLTLLTWMTMQGLLFYRPLPTIDGYYRFLGLDRSAEVVRDAFGIPRIEAGTVHDLFFLQGYVTAQDRFAQMEAIRGRAKSTFTNMPAPLDPTVIAAVEAYSQGVTKYIDQHAEARALPGEITLAGNVPEQWTPDDVMRVAEYLRGSSSVTCSVVPGSSSHRGLPLVAAQLDTFTPGLGWYEVGLDGPGLRAVGLSLPGLPGVIAGHNGSVGWAVDGLDLSSIVLAATARTVGEVAGEEACVADARGGTRGRQAPGSDLDVEALRLDFGATGPTDGGARIVIDLGDLDGSKAALSTGQSAHSTAFHYRDQAQMWTTGQLHRLGWTEAAIARTEGRLVLRPR